MVFFVLLSIFTCGDSLVSIVDNQYGDNRLHSGSWNGFHEERAGCCDLSIRLLHFPCLSLALKLVGAGFCCNAAKIWRINLYPLSVPREIGQFSSCFSPLIHYQSSATERLQFIARAVCLIWQGTQHVSAAATGDRTSPCRPPDDWMTKYTSQHYLHSANLPQVWTTAYTTSLSLPIDWQTNNSEIELFLVCSSTSGTFSPKPVLQVTTCDHKYLIKFLI